MKTWNTITELSNRSHLSLDNYWMPRKYIVKEGCGIVCRILLAGFFNQSNLVSFLLCVCCNSVCCSLTPLTPEAAMLYLWSLMFLQHSKWSVCLKMNQNQWKSMAQNLEITCMNSSIKAKLTKCLFQVKRAQNVLTWERIFFFFYWLQFKQHSASTNARSKPSCASVWAVISNQTSVERRSRTKHDGERR